MNKKLSIKAISRLPRLQDITREHRTATDAGVQTEPELSRSPLHRPLQPKRCERWQSSRGTSTPPTNAWIMNEPTSPDRTDVFTGSCCSRFKWLHSTYN